MIKVKDRLRIKSSNPVLICDLFADDVITNRLKTDIGIFEESSFAIGDVKSCFSQPTSRTILLRTDKDCSKISEVEFV